MDGKGRVSIPARFREELSLRATEDALAERVVVTRTFQRCLVVYPFEQWLNFEEKIRQLPQFDPNVQRLKRVYIASAVEATLDSHGRMLVPQQMRDFGGFEREVVWVGQLDTFELWSRPRWEEAFSSAMDDPQALAQAMADLGL